VWSVTFSVDGGSDACFPAAMPAATRLGRGGPALICQQMAPFDWRPAPLHPGAGPCLDGTRRPARCIPICEPGSLSSGIRTDSSVTSDSWAAPFRHSPVAGSGRAMGCLAPSNPPGSDSRCPSPTFFASFGGDASAGPGPIGQPALAAAAAGLAWGARCRPGWFAVVGGPFGARSRFSPGATPGLVVRWENDRGLQNGSILHDRITGRLKRSITT